MHEKMYVYIPSVMCYHAGNDTYYTLLI